MLKMMLRPRWVLALLLALGIAAGFALLGQWQLDRAIEQAVVDERPTEEVKPLGDVAQPDGFTEQAATGQRVEVTGSFVRWIIRRSITGGRSSMRWPRKSCAASGKFSRRNNRLSFIPHLEPEPGKRPS